MQKQLINENKNLQAQSQQSKESSKSTEDSDDSRATEKNEELCHKERDPDIYKPMNPESSSSWDDSESRDDPNNHQAVRKSQRYKRVLRLLRAERK